MLILARSLQQNIIIGDDIKIIIVGIAYDKVRLGIEAPFCVPVHREEIYWKIQRERLRPNKELSFMNNQEEA